MLGSALAMLAGTASRSPEVRLGPTRHLISSQALVREGLDPTLCSPLVSQGWWQEEKQNCYCHPWWHFRQVTGQI